MNGKPEGMSRPFGREAEASGPCPQSRKDPHPESGSSAWKSRYQGRPPPAAGSRRSSGQPHSFGAKNSGVGLCAIMSLLCGKIPSQRSGTGPDQVQVDGERGRPILVRSTLSHAVRDECKRLGMDDPPPLHGLRKNAVMALVEAGCEPCEIQAITAQSLQTIEHHAAKYKRERLGQAATLKLEKRN